MARHNRKLSFTTPIVVGFAGILLSFLLIAIFVTATQKKNFLEDYQHINRNFTHNLAVNYTESLLRENDYILARATKYFARDDALNSAVNLNPQKGLDDLMRLQELMPTVSSISLADTLGHYLRAPEVMEGDESRTFDPKRAPGLFAVRKPVPSASIPLLTLTTSPTTLPLPSTGLSFHRREGSKVVWHFIWI